MHIFQHLLLLVEAADLRYIPYVGSFLLSVLQEKKKLETWKGLSSLSLWPVKGHFEAEGCLAYAWNTRYKYDFGVFTFFLLLENLIHVDNLIC